MSEVIEDIIEAFPEFLTDEPINGGDLVEYIGNLITRYENGRPKPCGVCGAPPGEVHPMACAEYVEEDEGDAVQCADCGTKSHSDYIGQTCPECKRGIIK